MILSLGGNISYNLDIAKEVENYLCSYTLAIRHVNVINYQINLLILYCLFYFKKSHILYSTNE